MPRNAPQIQNELSTSCRVITVIELLALIIGVSLFARWTSASERDALMLACVGIWIVVFVYLIFQRHVLFGNLRKMKHAIDKNDYEAALKYSEAFLAFTERHPGLDKYRDFIPFAGTERSYRETALFNIAAVYGKMLDWEKYEAGLRRVLAEYPESRLASDSLKHFESMKTSFAGKPSGSGSPSA